MRRSSSSALASLALFLVAVCQLDPIVRWLWPIPVAGFVVYPYLKRFTWLCHLWLGAVDGLAPVGAWVAITGQLPWQAWALGGAVALWVAGFDLFYSLFDLEFDREHGLHSFATRFGERASLLGRAACARGDRRPARRGRASGSGSASSTGSACRRRGAARLRARARPARRPASAERGVLHDERHHQRRLLRLRARGSCFVKVAALYDVHGNLPALEAVLAEVPDEAVIVSGGDVFSGPMPAETLARLRGLGPRVHFIRGNADRDLGPYEERWRARYEWLMAQLTPEEHALAEAWPPTATLEVDGLGRTLFCHGTPRSDLEAITAVTSDERLGEILSEVRSAPSSAVTRTISSIA